LTKTHGERKRLNKAQYVSKSLYLASHFGKVVGVGGSNKSLEVRVCFGDMIVLPKQAPLSSGAALKSGHKQNFKVGLKAAQVALESLSHLGSHVPEHTLRAAS